MGKQRFVHTLRDSFLLLNILQWAPFFWNYNFSISGSSPTYLLSLEGFRFAFHPKHYLATGIWDPFLPPLKQRKQL